MLDLIVLAADGQMSVTLETILSRHHSLGIRQITSKHVTHPGRDAGCLLGPELILQSQSKNFTNALVVFDKEGCGREELSSAKLRFLCLEKLRINGWGERARVIVLEPELEAWVWSNSSQVDAALGWEGRIPLLRDWLVEEGFMEKCNDPPIRPKEAMEAALKAVRKNPSSAIFKKLASKVSLSECANPHFERLRRILKKWYPIQ